MIYLQHGNGEAQGTGWYQPDRSRTKKKLNNTSQKLKMLLRGALLITQITKNSHKKIPRTLRQTSY